MKLLAALVVMVLLAQPAWSGPNRDVSLAMHVVATDEYLDCDDLAADVCPADCRKIENSASSSDIAASLGYVYVCLLAYHFSELTSVEFALEGWPSGAGGHPGLSYCPNQQQYGNPWSGGVAAGFGYGILPPGDAQGVYCFAFTNFNANSVSGHWPIEISYEPSGFTTNPSVGNKVTGPIPDYEIDMVEEDRQHGCTIGDRHSEAVPYDDCEQGGSFEETTWSNVKSMYR